MPARDDLGSGQERELAVDLLRGCVHAGPWVVQREHWGLGGLRRSGGRRLADWIALTPEHRQHLICSCPMKYSMSDASASTATSASAERSR